MSTPVNYLSALGKGLVQGAGDVGTGLYNTFAHPINTATGLSNQMHQFANTPENAENSWQGNLLNVASHAPIVGPYVQQAISGGTTPLNPTALGAGMRAATSLGIAPRAISEGIGALKNAYAPQIPTNVLPYSKLPAEGNKYFVGKTPISSTDLTKYLSSEEPGATPNLGEDSFNGYMDRVAPLKPLPPNVLKMPSPNIPSGGDPFKDEMLTPEEKMARFNQLTRLDQQEQEGINSGKITPFPKTNIPVSPKLPGDTTNNLLQFPGPEGPFTPGKGPGAMKANPIQNLALERQEMPRDEFNQMAQEKYQNALNRANPLQALSNERQGMNPEDLNALAQSKMDQMNLNTKANNIYDRLINRIGYNPPVKSIEENEAINQQLGLKPWTPEEHIQNQQAQADQIKMLMDELGYKP